MSQLKAYDTEIEPLLKEASKKCKEHGFEIYYAVVLKPGSVMCGYTGDEKYITPTTPIHKLFLPQMKSKSQH